MDDYSLLIIVTKEDNKDDSIDMQSCLNDFKKELFSKYTTMPNIDSKKGQILIRSFYSSGAPKEYIIKAKSKVRSVIVEIQEKYKQKIEVQMVIVKLIEEFL